MVFSLQPPMNRFRRNVTGIPWPRGAVGSGSPGERRLEVAELRVDRRRILHGLADLVAQQLAVAASQPVDGDLDGSLRHVQLGSERGLRSVPLLGQETPEALEEVLLAGGAELLAQPGQDLLEQRERPAALEEPLRGCVVARLERVAALRLGKVEREVHGSAAS